MKKVVVLLFLVLGIINVSHAQEQQIEVTGIVTDAPGANVPGTLYVKLGKLPAQPGFRAAL